MSDKMDVFAIHEAARNAALDEYFRARPQLTRTRHEEYLFEAGFDRAWQAAKSVPVVGEPVAWLVDKPLHNVNMSKSTPIGLGNATQEPLYRAPTNSITAAELERLRNKVASAERDLAVAVAEGDRIMCEWQEQIRKTCAALKQRNDAEQACDALRKDAERYRWLRDANNDPGGVIDKIPHPGLSLYRAESELDHAIDAAIAAEGGRNENLRCSL